MDIKPIISSKVSPKKTDDIHVYNQIKRDKDGEVIGFVLQEPSRYYWAHCIYRW